MGRKPFDPDCFILSTPPVALLDASVSTSYSPLLLGYCRIGGVVSVCFNFLKLWSLSGVHSKGTPLLIKSLIGLVSLPESFINFFN